MAYTILIPDRTRPPATVEGAVFGEQADFVTPQATDAHQIPDALWAAADAILLWHDVAVEAETVAKLDRCKVIVRIGVGFDNVDLAAAGAQGIQVCNVPDYGTNDVADHATGLLLALCRGLFGYDAAARRGAWQWESVADLRRITRSTLGIIGLGRIGTATARRAAALGMRVVFYDPYKEDGYDKALGFERFDELETMIAECDAVSFHVPLTEETRGMADAAFFETLKRDAVLINTSRGAVIELDALWSALADGRLRAAGLDVLEKEPPDPSHPMIHAWTVREEWLEGRLVITPHAAFHNNESVEEMRRKAAEEAQRVLSGRSPRNCVNLDFLEPGRSGDSSKAGSSS